MKLNEYQEISKRTMPNNDFKKDLANYAMGLSGESGEVELEGEVPKHNFESFSTDHTNYKDAGVLLTK